MGWVIAALAVALAMFIPVGISTVYDENGGRIRFIAGPVSILVYPAKKDPDKSAKSKKKAKEEASANTASSKNGGYIADFYPFITLVLDFLCDFRRKLRVNLFQLHIMLAGGDPADLAQNYGKAWAAVGALWPNLERFLVIKKRDVKVQCDFEDGKTSVFARMDLTLTLGRLLSMTVRYGSSILKEFFRFRKKRNGGTV